MPCCRNRLTKTRITSELRQNFFDLQHHVVFVSQRHFKANFPMNNIPRPAEVRDYRDGTHCQGLEDHAASKVANRWKNQHVSHCQPLYHFTMVYPPAEGNNFLNSQRSSELLKVRPLRTIADDGEVGPARLQKPGGRRAERGQQP